MDKIGYIGLGAMGGGMARNLLRKGRDLMVYDTRASVSEEFRSLGATVAGSPRELAGECSMVLSSLPGSTEVRSVYLGEGNVAASLVPGSLAIEMSTVPPGVSQEIASVLAERGSSFIDAPVARTKQAAQDGTLAIMVGGDEADFKRARPVLDLMGTSISHVGPVGAGSIAKLVNNAVLMANILAVSEGLILGQKAGVDPMKLARVLSEGSADSFALRSHVIGSVLPGTFGEGRFPLTYAVKDINYFLKTADSADLVAPLLRHMSETYKAALGRGVDLEYFPVATTVLDESNRTTIVGSAR